jgi:sarcosine oxidase, subunit beta
VSRHTADVIVVGAGIIGLNIAFQIARRGALRVHVLERAAAVGAGSTGASSAICRTRYTHLDTIALARDGIEAYRSWAEFTGLAAPHAQFHEHGVLWLPGNQPGWARREHARLAELGIVTAVLDDEALCEEFPALSVCTEEPDLLEGAEHACRGGGEHLLEVHGGFMDPMEAAQDLVTALRQRGSLVQFNAHVQQILRSRDAVVGVRLADGQQIDAPLLINAAGPWCRDLYAEAGVELPWRLEPTRIQMLYRDRPPELPGPLPVTLDMAGGIYFRTQNRGQQLVVGSVLERHEQEYVSNPDEFDSTADPDFQSEVLHALHHRLPSLSYYGTVRSYCGLYTINRDDMHPILGPSGVPGFWVANGFSGHGFKLAPAIGALIARALSGAVESFDCDVPLEFLSPQRNPISLTAKSVLA